MYRVAYDAHTETLLLLVLGPTYEYYQLVSLRRNASEWIEVQRVNHKYYYSRPNFVMCDSRVLLVECVHRYTMYVFDVSAEHTLRDAGSVTFHSKPNAVACTRRDGVTLVAFTQYTSVSLLRLTSIPLRL